MNDTAGHKTAVQGLDRYGQRELVRSVMRIIIQLIILFAAAGTVNWPLAWAYGGFQLMLIGVYALVMIKANPALLNARGRRQDNTKTFDKVFYALWIPLVLTIYLVSGLDAGRFHWSSMPAWASLAGAALILAAALFGYWAMAVNTHFEVTVRIQDDREHRVVTAGPYQYVRHPGYVGMILVFFGVPLFLGSRWGLAPAAAHLVLVVFRTALEDRTLRRELPGYDEYASRTRWRLLPGAW